MLSTALFLTDAILAVAPSRTPLKQKGRVVQQLVPGMMGPSSQPDGMSKPSARSH